MKKIPALLCAVALAGCTATGGTTSVKPTSVCQAIANAAANPAVAAQIATLNPQSALAQLWTYANSGCVGIQAAANVTPSWTQQVWAGFLQLAPQILPVLVGLL